MPSRTRSGSSPAWPSAIRPIGAHDLARRAEAALEAVMVDEGGLHRMQRVAVGQALDGGDLGAVVADRERQAGIDPAAVDQHGAGAALAAVAAFLGAGEVRRSRSRSSSVTRGSSSSTSCRVPFTVRLMDSVMRGSDRCYRGFGSKGVAGETLAAASRWAPPVQARNRLPSIRKAPPTGRAVAYYMEASSVYQGAKDGHRRYGTAGRKDNAEAAGGFAAQPGAAAGGGEGGVQRRRAGCEPGGRGAARRKSASARSTGISRRERRFSRRSTGARSSSSPSWPTPWRRRRPRSRRCGGGCTPMSIWSRPRRGCWRRWRSRPKARSTSTPIRRSGWPGAVGKLLKRAVEAGEVRGDVSAEDLLRALIGMCYMREQPGWTGTVKKLVDVFVDGLSVRPGPDR